MGLLVAMMGAGHASVLRNGELPAVEGAVQLATGVFRNTRSGGHAVVRIWLGIPVVAPTEHVPVCSGVTTLLMVLVQTVDAKGDVTACVEPTVQEATNCAAVTMMGLQLTLIQLGLVPVGADTQEVTGRAFSVKTTPGQVVPV